MACASGTILLAFGAGAVCVGLACFLLGILALRRTPGGTTT